MALLEPTELELTTLKGTKKTYWISKFPAIAGREIIAKYPLSAMPKLGDYAVNEETMFKLMCYVGVTMNDRVQELNTRALIDNHVPDWETLAKIEIAMMKYNTSFFGNGEISGFLKTTLQKGVVSVSPMLTDLLQRLSDQAKQHFTSLNIPTRSKKRSTSSKS